MELEYKKITSIKTVNKKQKVYNFDVPEFQNYIANGIVVHNCQNFDISWKKPENCKYFSASAIVHMAQVKRCKGVCFTYNEPSISYEFLMDVAEKCHETGLFFSIKTNGFVEKEPWKDICEVCDAMNIDWKIGYTGFSDEINYSEIVLRNIETAISHDDLHVEVSIPVYSDIIVGEEDAIVFFFGECYPDIPVHLLKVFPTDYFNLSTVEDNVILDLRKRMMDKSKFVYAENIFTEDGRLARETTCPECKTVVAKREALTTVVTLNKECETCKSIFVI